MNYRITSLPETKLVGIKSHMSFAVNSTPDLWRRFMPQRKLVQQVLSPDLYSVELYPAGFFDDIDTHCSFEKWAAVRVASFQDQPEQLDQLVIPQGMYAVFLYIGAASNAATTYEYIFRKWLPFSKYRLDERPHFALMGEKYKNNDPSSEEEIWIPIKTV